MKSGVTHPASKTNKQTQKSVLLDLQLFPSFTIISHSILHLTAFESVKYQRIQTKHELLNFNLLNAVDGNL